MEIPIELFLGGIGVSLALGLFGFLRNPQIPAMLVFGGMFILIFAVATEGILINSFASGNTDNLYAYNVESRSAETTIFAGSQVARAEFASSSSSQLIGKEIDCVDIYLRKLGVPTGIATVGIFANQQTPLISNTFNTIDVTTLTTSSNWYSFCLPSGQTYTIVNQDRIGIFYNSGDGSNHVVISSDTSNPFDGTITFKQQITIAGPWSSTTTEDYTMRMYLQGAELEITDNVYEFTELPKTLFGLIGAIFMLCGALMVARND